MTPFSDDELKQWKQIVAPPCTHKDPWGCVYPVDRCDVNLAIRELIERLEAAEACARQLDSIDSSRLMESDKKALKEWRKAAGK